MDSYASFVLPEAVLYGRGSFARLGAEAAVRGTKALIVSDNIMVQMGYVEHCAETLGVEGVAHVSYTNVNTEPTDIYVAEALELFQKENCNLLIAIGGGSCIDTAKAVAVVATNGGYIGDYMGARKLAATPAVPLIAVPTTAGTGSEVTDVTVITNTTDDVKMMIKQRAFLPKVAIVDPFLTLSSPPKVTAATGVDALCHAIEAYISRLAHPMTDTFALAAIDSIVKNLRAAYQDGNNIDAREAMSLAAMQAGAAFSNASVCLVHGMSRPIGAVFHVAHGISNAMLLPAVLEFTMEAAVGRLAVIARTVNPDLQSATDREAASELVAEIKKLCADLDIPNLKQWGIPEDEFKRWISKMADDAIASGSPGNNPLVPTKEEIESLYETCYTYQFSSSAVSM